MLTCNSTLRAAEAGSKGRGEKLCERDFGAVDKRASERAKCTKFSNGKTTKAEAESLRRCSLLCTRNAKDGRVHSAAHRNVLLTPCIVSHLFANSFSFFFLRSSSPFLLQFYAEN